MYVCMYVSKYMHIEWCVCACVCICVVTCMVTCVCSVRVFCVWGVCVCFVQIYNRGFSLSLYCVLGTPTLSTPKHILSGARALVRMLSLFLSLSLFPSPSLLFSPFLCLSVNESRCYGIPSYCGFLNWLNFLRKSHVLKAFFVNEACVCHPIQPDPAILLISFGTPESILWWLWKGNDLQARWICKFYCTRVLQT